MQHYGLPTRLLDWTESPLFACYFAIEKGTEDTDGALFALCPYTLNANQLKRRKLLMPYDSPAIDIINSLFKYAKENHEEIIAIRPSEVDIRLLVQLSVFTIHGSNKSLEQLPGNQKFLIKIRIPKTAKQNLRKQLKRLGIRASNIFPDLEHLAKEIKSTKFKKPDPSEQFLDGGRNWVSDESAT
jgi:hypothetical protein